MSGVEKRHFTVIGAGTVGVCTALWLMRDGHEVTLIDRQPPGSGCSFGNGALIQTGACVPIATPGVLRQVPRMLLDPDGPLVIRWQHLLSLAPYLWHFVGSARPSRVEKISIALQTVLDHAIESYRTLLEEADGLHLIRQSGELYVYERETSYRSARPWHELRRRRGVEVVDLSANEIRELEPALAPFFKRGVYLPNSVQTSNPYRLTVALAEQFVRRGGHLVQEEVRDVVGGEQGPTSIDTDSGSRPIDQIVLATGAHSKRWAAKLACWLPLDTERGYHIMLPQPGINLRTPVLSGDYRFGLVPLSDGIRLAGTAELAKVDAPPRFERAERLVSIARRMLPGLSDHGFTRWMGQRPSTPDSLPVICRSPRFPSVYLAFGHGHLGLTLGAVTGRLISDLAAGRPPIVPLAPYDIRRFGRFTAREIEINSFWPATGN